MSEVSNSGSLDDVIIPKTKDLKAKDIVYKGKVNTISSVNKPLNVKAKKLTETATLPSKGRDSDAGFDLYADEDTELEPGKQCLVSTSIALEIPEGYVGLIWPRSGLAVNNCVDVLAGVIDSGYRGEVKVCLVRDTVRGEHTFVGQARKDRNYKISKGDKIAQILIQEVPNLKMIETDTLSDSDRGEKGFGSSGR